MFEEDRVDKRASANSIPYLELETILLRFLYRASFLFVPLPGLIPDRHPFSMCFLKLSASFSAACDKTDHPLYSTSYHFIMKLLSCATRTAGAGVAFVLSAPLSVGSLNTIENSFMHSCLSGCLFGTLSLTLLTA